MEPIHQRSEPPPSAGEGTGNVEPQRIERLSRYLAAAAPLPPSGVDAAGRSIPRDSPEYQQRLAEYRRRLDERDARLGDVGEDPPDTLERMMRGIAEDRRQAGMRALFEGDD